jgi:hypothetical protein
VTAVIRIYCNRPVDPHSTCGGVFHATTHDLAEAVAQALDAGWSAEPDGKHACASHRSVRPRPRLTW